MDLIRQAFLDYGLNINHYRVNLNTSKEGHFSGSANWLMRKVNFTLPLDKMSEPVYAAMIRFTIYHELGHLVDKSNLKCALVPLIYPTISYLAMKYFLPKVDLWIMPLSIILYLLISNNEVKKSEHRANAHAVNMLLTKGDFLPIAAYLAGLELYRSRGVNRTCLSHPKAVDEMKAIIYIVWKNKIDISINNGVVKIGDQVAACY